jgi:hypothetical protein
VKRMRIGLVSSSGNGSHIIVFGMCLDRIWAVTLAVLTEGDWFIVSPRECANPRKLPMSVPPKYTNVLSVMHLY